MHKILLTVIALFISAIVSVSAAETTAVFHNAETAESGEFFISDNCSAQLFSVGVQSPTKNFE